MTRGFIHRKEDNLLELKISSNESDQRADRFLKKYLAKANSGFIYKMIRKKNIKLNNKRLKPEEILKEGDIIQLYLSDETISKFTEDEEDIINSVDLNIVYEDSNIIIMNKDIGMLSHSIKSNYSEKDIVSNMISYLYKKGEYNPRLEKTFSPAICNRLDRNTSGLLIGAKNYNSLKKINYAIKNRKVEKYYKTIVLGSVERDISLKGYLYKDEDRNKAFITDEDSKDSKEIITDIKILKKNREYSLLEINLITGRTHQIRAHLSSIKHPIIGDRKYGNRDINRIFNKEYGLKNQLLHAYKIVLNGLDGELEYLNGKVFINEEQSIFNRIERDLFK